MAYSLVAHTHVAGATHTGTTGPVDTTGAVLLVAIISAFVFSGTGALTITDSKFNIWTQIGTLQQSGVVGVAMFYCANPTVGSGHTFTWNDSAGFSSGSFSALEIQAWSGAATSPLDRTNQAAGTQAGSVTPTQDNELVVIGYGAADNSAPSTIDGSFTISDQDIFSSGVNEGAGAAYLIQTTAAAANPTWTHTGATASASIIATFKTPPPPALAPRGWFDAELIGSKAWFG